MEFFSDFIHYDFLAKALVGAILLALTCGLISPILVAKKYAFIGEGISHSTVLAMALTVGVWQIQSPQNIFLSGLLFTLIISLFLAYGTLKQKIPSDAVIGIFLVGTLSSGIILFSLSPAGQSQMMSILFGNILTLTLFDLVFQLFLCLLVFLIISLNFRKILFFVYDEVGAQVNGIPVVRYHFLLIFALAFLIVCSMKLAGTILINALLIIPGAFAIKYAQNIYQTFWYSILFSLGAAVVGLFLANWHNLPPGATLALSYFFFFIIFWFIFWFKELLQKRIHQRTFR